jgi:hypothetical protein
MKVHPEFSDTMKMARCLAQEWWEDTLAGQARGRYEGGSATAAIFAMKNQFPDDYRDRREHYVEVTDTVEIEYIDHVGYEVLDEG